MLKGPIPLLFFFDNLQCWVQFRSYLENHMSFSSTSKDRDNKALSKVSLSLSLSPPPLFFFFLYKTLLVSGFSKYFVYGVHSTEFNLNKTFNRHVESQVHA